MLLFGRGKLTLEGRFDDGQVTNPKFLPNLTRIIFAKEQLEILMFDYKRQFLLNTALGSWSSIEGNCCDRESPVPKASSILSSNAVDTLVLNAALGHIYYFEEAEETKGFRIIMVSCSVGAAAVTFKAVCYVLRLQARPFFSMMVLSKMASKDVLLENWIGLSCTISYCSNQDRPFLKRLSSDI